MRSGKISCSWQRCHSSDRPEFMTLPYKSWHCAIVAPLLLCWQFDALFFDNCLLPHASFFSPRSAFSCGCFFFFFSTFSLRLHSLFCWKLLKIKIACVHAMRSHMHARSLLAVDATCVGSAWLWGGATTLCESWKVAEKAHTSWLQTLMKVITTYRKPITCAGVKWMPPGSWEVNKFAP